MSTGQKTIVLFEDAEVAGLGPLAALRPAFESRVGALNLRERLELCGGGFSCAAAVRESVQAELLLPGLAPGGAELQVNARLAGTVEDLESTLDRIAIGDALMRGDTVLIAWGETERRLDAPDGLFLLDHPWDLVRYNDQLLRADADTLKARGGPVRRIHGIDFEADSGRGDRLAATEFVVGLPEGSGAMCIGAHVVLLGDGAMVRPTAVIDAQAGPVVLGAGVVIHPLAVVTGPAYLGPGTVVNPGARLREGTSAGAFCKLGGEIEESVIGDLSNKQHDGFLGHAVVGNWVNLGAATNGSDLKNNYSQVKVDLGDGPLDTGQNFFGQVLGDHAKTAIGTMLTTGGVVGIGANLFGAGTVPRLVPAFAWGGAAGMHEYRIEEALSTARAVYARRDARWTAAAETALRRHFEETAALRSRLGVQ